MSGEGSLYALQRVRPQLERACGGRTSVGAIAGGVDHRRAAVHGVIFESCGVVLGVGDPITDLTIPYIL